LATKAELVWPLPAEMDDAALERRLYPQPSTRASAFTEPDYARVHQELKRKGMTLSLLWEEWSLSGVDNTVGLTLLNEGFFKHGSNSSDRSEPQHRSLGVF
jgi:hypothetical protein